jgi:hypothetical protein
MKRCFSLAVLIALVTCIPFGTGVGLAKTDIIPGGPWLTDKQPEILDSLLTNEELVNALKQVEKTSKGLIQLEVIGYTNQGREIYLAKSGEPDPSKPAVMIISQQHGNQVCTAEAAVELLKFLASASKPAKEILDNVCVVVIPRVNPDGAELFQRYNDDPSAPAPDAFCGIYTSEGVGWDINRYHYLDWTDSPLFACDSVTYPINPVPEAQAVVNTYMEYQPLWVADFQGQNTLVTPDGENVTSSILWPTNSEVTIDAVALSKKLCVTIMDHMAQFGYATVTKFFGGSEAGIARNAYGLAGAGSILVDLKGGIGQKQNGMIIMQALEEMKCLLEATADGSLYTADPDRVDELPLGSDYSKDLPPN